MKILMLTPYLPYPPASGGQIRTYNLLKYLSKTHDVTLISLYKNEREKQYASYLKSYCKNIYLCKRPEKPWQIGNILKSVFSFLPFLIVRNFSYEAQETIAKLLREEQFDVIHAETFYIMPHIPKTSTPILLVEQTIEFKVYQHFISSLPVWVRLAFYLDIVKLKYWESYYWKKATLVSSVSEYDRDMIKKLAPELEPVVIPNGAGDEMFVKSLTKKEVKNPTILFMGNFYWLQNVEAAHYLLRDVYPQLKKEIPNIQLIIAGQNSRLKLGDENDKNVSIVNIPQDDAETVKKLYSEASVFLAPIFGPGGTRLKILAAMASGLPVIATKTGVEGLGTENNTHVLIANTNEEFVEQTKRILSDKKLYESLRKEAYELVKEKFSWRAIALQLEIVYRTLTTQ